MTQRKAKDPRINKDSRHISVQSQRRRPTNDICGFCRGGVRISDVKYPRILPAAASLTHLEKARIDNSHIRIRVQQLSPLETLIFPSVEETRDQNFPSHSQQESNHQMFPAVGRLESDTLPSPRSLLFPKVLYGRGKEQECLLQAFRRVTDKTNPSSEVVFVHGRSGSGKTALVKSMTKLLVDEGHSQQGDTSSFTFVEGKYDQQLSTDPYSALSSILSDLVKNATTLHTHRMASIRASILESVDVEGISTLSALIPNLSRIVCAQRNSRVSGRSNQEQAFTKLMSSVCSFVRSLIDATLPTVIFLDDLQFASKESIELIRALATDVSIRGMLLVLTYRTDEVNHNSCLESFINTMLIQPWDDELFRHPANEIEVNNLMMKDIDQIVRGVTKTPDEVEMLSLSRLILQKTHGQAFHVIQFLEMLKDRQFLLYDKGSYKFDLDRIQEETNVSENVASLVSGRIQMLPAMTRYVLAFAACLGFCFPTEQLLRLSINEVQLVERHHLLGADDDPERLDFDRDEIEVALKTCVAESLLEFANDTHMKFSHDQVLQTVLISIPSETKLSLHLCIGKYLVRNMFDSVTEAENEAETEASVYLAVDQFSRSREIIRDMEDVADLCRVNLAAGKLSVAKCAFAQGAEFLQEAASMASKADIWDHQYDLALEVFTVSAEYESYAGRLESSNEMVDVVLSKATKLEDMIRVYYVRLEGLAMEERLVEAASLGLTLLEQLGEKLERQLTSLQTLRKLIKISWMMRRRGRIGVDSMKKMSNWKKITAMNVLSLLFGVAWFLGDSGLFLAITLKSMSLTLKSGLSPFAAGALATYARLLVALHRTDESYQVGQFALEVHKKLGSKENEGFMFLLLVSFVNHSRESSRSQLPLINQSYNSAMACCQNWYATVAFVARLQLNFLVGTPLSRLNHDCTVLRNITTNRVATACGLPVIQLIACLQDRHCNPFTLSGEILDEQDFAVLCEANGNERALVLLCTFQIAQAFFFHVWDRVVEAYESFTSSNRTLWSKSKAILTHTPMAMWIGSAYINLARFDSLYIGKARRFLRDFRRLAASGNPDGFVYLKMLEAEYAVLIGTPTAVRDAFECAIMACQVSGFVQYDAHLSERLGIVLIELGQFEMAEGYISRALQKFEAWSARAKVRTTKQMLKAVRRQIQRQAVGVELRQRRS